MRCWWPQSLCDGSQVRLEREELLASLEDQTSELEAREQEVILISCSLRAVALADAHQQPSLVVKPLPRNPPFREYDHHPIPSPDQPLASPLPHRLLQVPSCKKRSAPCCPFTLHETAFGVQIEQLQTQLKDVIVSSQKAVGGLKR